MNVTVKVAIALSLLVPRLAESEPVALTRQLDGAKYLPDQPHMVLACVENSGTDTLQDLASLYPGDGNLRLTLHRLGTEGTLPLTGPTMDLVSYTGEGLRLAPGLSQCEAVDLLDWFGAFTTEATIVGETSLHHRLSTGMYTLRADMRAHTETRKRGDSTLP